MPSWVPIWACSRLSEQRIQRKGRIPKKDPPSMNVLWARLSQVPNFRVRIPFSASLADNSFVVLLDCFESLSLHVVFSLSHHLPLKFSHLPLHLATFPGLPSPDPQAITSFSPSSAVINQVLAFTVSSLPVDTVSVGFSPTGRCVLGATEPGFVQGSFSLGTSSDTVTVNFPVTGTYTLCVSAQNDAFGSVVYYFPQDNVRVTVSSGKRWCLGEGFQTAGSIQNMLVEAPGARLYRLFRLSPLFEPCVLITSSSSHRCLGVAQRSGQY